MSKRIERKDDRRYLLQACGVAVLIATAMLAGPASRTVYRWAKKASYARAEVEVVSDGATRGRWVTVRVVPTGERLSVKGSDFPELMSEGTLAHVVARAGQRFVAWYDPDAHASAGIQLFDQRLVSVRSHPELATGEEAALGATATLALAALGLYLFTAPRRAGPRGGRPGAGRADPVGSPRRRKGA